MWKIVVLLFLAFITAGCLSNANIEDRLACLELTSYAFTSVPECNQQDDCFAEVEKAFPFNEEVFSSRVQQELFEAKNHLARSWLFLNKSKSNLEIIHNQCYTAKNLSKIPKQVNELNSNLVIVGEEVDLFNKAAVKAIYFEIDELELDDVNAIKEEFLFDDYVLLNQNVLDFFQKNLYNDTYASRFLFEAKKFNTIASALEIQGVIKETTLFGILAENDKTILKEAKKNDFPISIIGPVFSGLSVFLRDFIALETSVESLKALPSFEFFSAINSLIGKENSSSSAFFRLFINNSKHRVSLGEKNILQKEKINYSLAESEQKLDSITKLNGETFLPEIFSSTFGISGIGESQVSREELKNYSSSIETKINSVKSSLRLLEEAEFLGTITIGKKTKTLKNMNSETKNIIEEIGYIEGLFSGAKEKCSENLFFIKGNISSEEFNSTNPVIISLKSRIKAQIGFFESSKEISACSSAIQNYAKLLENLDSGLSEEEISLSVEGCISTAESLLEFDEENEITVQLDSLKRVEKPYSNPELVLNSCLDIKSRLEEKAYSKQNVSSASKEFSALTEKISKIKNLVEQYPDSGPEKKLKSLFDDYELLSKNFENALLKISEINNSEKIVSQIKKDKEKTDALLKEIAQNIFEKHHSIEFIASEENNTLTRIFLEKGVEINVPFKATINLDSRKAEEVFSTKNILFSSNGTKTLLNFSKMLQGLNSIVLDLNAHLKGKEEPVSVEKKEEKTGFGEKVKLVLEKEELNKKAESLDEKKEPELGFFNDKIDFFIDQNKFEKASEELKKLKDFVEKSKKEKNNAINLKEKELLISDKTEKINSLKKSLKEKTTELENNFSGLTEEELGEVYAFSPITLERINELKGLFEKDFEENNIDYTLKELGNADKEASRAIEKLKENSLSSYNVAVSKRNSSESNSELDSLLLKSKQSLEEKSYLKSILNSQKASNLTGLTTLSAGFEIPLPVYPLILVILGVAFYVYKKSGENKKPKPVTKIRKVSD